MSTKTAITFEQGYDDLERIVAELQGALPLNETVARVKRGHGLARTLKEHLAGLEAELRDIEDGKGLPEFEIVTRGDVAVPAIPGPASEGDFPASPTDDDIPF